MIVVLKSDVKKEDIISLHELIKSHGLSTKDMDGEGKSVVGVIGDRTKLDPRVVEAHHAVEKIIFVQEPFKLASKNFNHIDTVVDVSGVKVGRGHLALIAGPCSIESLDQMREIALSTKASGANMLRGGAFKPRSSPYSFQGLGVNGLDILAKAGQDAGLPIVTELMASEFLPEFIEKVDLIQIGARNMQNYELLKKIGKTNKPILLKRGLSATYEEWLMSAEYILSGGNQNVILCERGIRTFETYTRNTLDIQAIPVIKKLSHLPIIIDPSHAGGQWWMVDTMAKASLAAGADGIMVEVHQDPENAWSDGPQCLRLDRFRSLSNDLKLLNTALNPDVAARV
ncbi:MAG: 3-deoxy-7-phosphoheptulonate synthase [Brevinema sp.]